MIEQKLSHKSNPEEKAKDFLLDVMGKDYEKLIKEGKIEIKSGNNVYILTIDGGVINKSTNQGYCIVPKIAGLPLYDILAIKYSWLKYGHDIVERVARKHNLQLIHTDNGRIIRDRLTYDDFLNYMEDSGWRREHKIITESSPMISPYDNGMQIESPLQKMMTIKGFEQDVNRSGYRLWLKIYDKDDKELNNEDIIQVIKLNPDTGYKVLWKGSYEFLSISMTQTISINIGSPAGRTISVAGTPQYFTWRQGIVLNEKDLIVVKPENKAIKIDIDRIKFYMETDLWTRLPLK